MAYIPLARLHELYDGYRQSIRLAGQELLLVQDEGQVYLLANVCPHRQASLSNASINDGVLRCARHGLQFSLRTGQPLQAGGCNGSLQFFPLIYEGNTIGVEVSS